MQKIKHPISVRPLSGGRGRQGQVRLVRDVKRKGQKVVLPNLGFEASRAVGIDVPKVPSAGGGAEAGGPPAKKIKKRPTAVQVLHIIRKHRGSRS